MEFQAATSLCVVCEACDSVVGRAGDAIENYGKVAELVQTESPFQVGMRGQFKGTNFEITGRTQWRHAAGGVWDEWYAAFYDGARWGWIADAQGRQYLTFPKKVPEDHQLPPLEQTVVEQIIKLPTLGAMKIVECGEATAIAAEGEFPIAFHPGAKMRYADLQGPAGKFATMSQDPGSELELYVGKQVSLADLGVETALSREEELPTASAVSVSCPQCGGALELHAPAQTERVTCPNCMSLLDADQGNLAFLYKLGEVKVKPILPIGSKGELRGRQYTVIGFLERFIRYNKKVYRWEEYLLYTPRQPFRWLIQNQHHWTLAEAVSAGDCQTGAGTANARFKGREYRLFDISSPKVGVVLGEFYWKVAMGEQTRAWDYVRPPLMLSREESVPTEQEFSTDAVSERASANAPSIVSEVNYTLGEYVPHEEIDQAFQVKTRTPSSVAPNQPYPYSVSTWLAGGLLAAVLLAGALVNVNSPRKVVLQESFQLNEPTTVVAEAPDPNAPNLPASPPPLVTPAAPTGLPIRTEKISRQFMLQSGHNVAITMKLGNRSYWAHVEGSLYRFEDQHRRPFAAGLPTYAAEQTRYFSAPRAGAYSLNLTFTQQPGSQHQSVEVEIRQGVPRAGAWLIALSVVGMLFVGNVLGWKFFEKRRWSESDFG
ncbi:DUF4178 domain-containing protein [Lignipirellula cremea]|uniref:DUF4178 domain-containing protein n=1 Tax=Lignipirellula cremea TaxID=2528010 RepID=UPI0018D2298A|nr:DUF4178 domain-containing protein [Lignipirellula cremea]